MIKAWQKLYQNPTMLMSNKALQLTWCVQFRPSCLRNMSPEVKEQIPNRGHINAVCDQRSWTVSLPESTCSMSCNRAAQSSGWQRGDKLGVAISPSPPGQREQRKPANFLKMEDCTTRFYLNK